MTRILIGLILLLLRGAAPVRADYDPPCSQFVLLGCAAGDTWTGTHDFTGATLNLPSNAVDAIGEVASGIKTGNGGKLATSTGTLTSGRCVEIDANGNFIQAAAGCGTASLALDGLSDVTITSAATGQIVVKSAGDWVNVAMSGDVTINSSGVTAIGADKITSAMVGSNVLLGADISNSFLQWAEGGANLSGCTGDTCTLANAPRNIATNRDAVLIVRNGIVQKQVAATPGTNEFTMSGAVATFKASSAPTTAEILAWYETSL